MIGPSTEGLYEMGHRPDIMSATDLEGFLEFRLKFLIHDAGLRKCGHICPTPFKENSPFLHEIGDARPFDLVIQ